MTKFVTILARELGEWPENQTFATQDPDKEVRFNDSRHDFYASELADDAGEDYGEGVEVTREMWQAERERLSAPEWDGEGLPGVGVECEYRSGYVERPYTYSSCRIIAHFEGESGDTLAAFTHVSHDGVVQVSRGAAGLFRPIKSQRDKWIEAACESMKDARFTMPNTDVAPMDLAALYAGALYDAGLAKEV
ncbi:MAG: hypothetical protein Tp138OMZ00d2C19078221_26 [Prokaryotic dsDNA virus sp.]|jgi:hypothetical protein|nr:hypothetical protein [Pseudomonadales bacterium]QDP67454.1 MAG: hypothetical protein Tp138OMZ00d2C19078221_26 [Prokaryotic dsDNA virus sp.]|tara:strand:+ start:1218 stop:1793 length:576 start_codon:yes stop_codon:yes gene_type:complete